ncbi:MAG: transketolase [Defluviitaleaceae bacterium]|nr:transketolase [Defluviitaleaceae bacterium]MCL2238337.1 transketolase [Defluviitaleaceae bacterium]
MNICIPTLKEKAYNLRKTTLEITASAQAGRIASSYSCAEILTALYYTGIMRFDPKDPVSAARDRFIMSKSHASPILYAILADCGFFDKSELDKYAKPDGILGTLLDENVPGAEILGGSLGCGFGIAAGMAFALKRERSRSMVFTLLGDGECGEGSIWETAMFVGFQRLNNLITLIDRNHISASAFIQDDFGNEPFADKWRAFGFNVVTIDGHSFVELLETLKDVRSRRSASPTVVICETVKGKGIDFVENEPFWHSKAVTQDQLEAARKSLTLLNRGDE